MESIYTAIYEKLTTLQGLLRKKAFNKGCTDSFGDTARGQGRILAMLKIQPEIATKDLAYLLGIRQQSLNEQIRKLEKGGYVERKPSEEDRRVMIVHLTEKGKTVEQGEPECRYRTMFECLTEEELGQFGEYLDRIIEALGGQDDQEENEDRLKWMGRARKRMGKEAFERLMAMRERGFGSHRGFGARGRNKKHGAHGTYGMDDDRGTRGGRGKQGSRRRGGCSEHLPGAEQFSPDYGGPVPDRGEPFQWTEIKAEEE